MFLLSKIVVKSFCFLVCFLIIILNFKLFNIVSHYFSFILFYLLLFSCLFSPFHINTLKFVLEILTLFVLSLAGFLMFLQLFVNKLLVFVSLIILHALLHRQLLVKHITHSFLRQKLVLFFSSLLEFVEFWIILTNLVPVIFLLCLEIYRCRSVVKSSVSWLWVFIYLKTGLVNTFWLTICKPSITPYIRSHVNWPSNMSHLVLNWFINSRAYHAWFCNWWWLFDSIWI